MVITEYSTDVLHRLMSLSEPAGTDHARIRRLSLLMHRTLAISSAIALVMSAAACGDDTQGPTADDLRVQDSLLTHDVMAAWGDSFRVAVEEPEIKDSVAPSPAPSKTQAVVAPSPVVTQPAPSLAPGPTPATRPRSVTSVARTDRPQEKVRLPKSLSIRKGSQLSLVTNGRICSSRIGQTFGTTLLAPVPTSAGTIPSGARATAVITSRDEWGAGIGVRVTSIHSNGATYPVSSRVTYIVPENSDDGTCIPRRAHIDTEVRG